MTTLQGIDQKAVLQATLYGLPMTGFDAPGRAPIDGAAPGATAEAGPGAATAAAGDARRACRDATTST